MVRPTQQKISGSPTSVPTFPVWKCHQLDEVGAQPEKHLSPSYKPLFWGSSHLSPQDISLQGDEMLISPTYKRAQVRQGVRSSTVAECRRINFQLSSCIHLSCWQPAAEPVLCATQAWACAKLPHFEQETWAYTSRGVRGLPWCQKAKYPHITSILNVCLAHWSLLWTYTTKCLCSGGIPSL